MFAEQIYFILVTMRRQSLSLPGNSSYSPDYQQKKINLVAAGSPSAPIDAFLQTGSASEPVSKSTHGPRIVLITSDGVMPALAAEYFANRPDVSVSVVQVGRLPHEMSAGEFYQRYWQIDGKSPVKRGVDDPYARFMLSTGTINLRSRFRPAQQDPESEKNYREFSENLEREMKEALKIPKKD